MKYVHEFGKQAVVVRGRGAAVAVVLLGLTASGCGIGMPGYQEHVDGDYKQAQRDFTTDYQQHPDNSIAQMNMALTYRERGDRDKANVLFREAALSGKGVHPTDMTEPHDSNTTISDVACRYLAADHQSDPNCR